MAKKPTGERYSAVLSHQGSTAEIALSKINFPSEKRDIEGLVIETFDRSLDRETRRRFGITKIQQINNENDLDCLISSDLGNWRMDLAEFVPADLSKGGYAGATATFTNGELADCALNTIRDKDRRYASLGGAWLLLYTTAWQFAPSENSHLIVSDALMRNPPTLGRTMFIFLFPDGDGKVTTLHPVSLNLAYQALASDIRVLRTNRVTNKDVRTMESKIVDGKAEFWFPPSA